jgi:hypothetical protein
MIEPLRFSFDVDVPADHAFQVWTSRTSMWWPTPHTWSGEPGLKIIFEPWVGGRIFERTPSGQEYEWGEITHWEPPRRLAYLWHIMTDRADATDVEIAFIDLGDARTRVEIEHRGWERLGDRGQSWRDTNHGGWDEVLPIYRAVLSRADLEEA